MRRVYKYPIELSAFQNVEMPIGAVIKSAINQNGQISLYAIVNPDESTTEYRHILVFGTGYDIPNELGELEFIATVTTDDTYVWHIFEKV